MVASTSHCRLGATGAGGRIPPAQPPWQRDAVARQQRRREETRHFGKAAARRLFISAINSASRASETTLTCGVRHGGVAQCSLVTKGILYSRTLVAYRA